MKGLSPLSWYELQLTLIHLCSMFHSGSTSQQTLLIIPKLNITITKEIIKM
jgi:hypothetical protein